VVDEKGGGKCGERRGRRKMKEGKKERISGKEEERKGRIKVRFYS
jgi:hypothetical protein